MALAMRRLVLALVLLVGVAVSGGAAMAEPPQTHEILSERPSGFWTSNAPAENGAYRWRLLGIGGIFAAVTGVLMVRTIKRANAERRGRPDT
jgi:hypothetical protein